ncbi:MAG TPA: OmpA family protein, partial [Candidatus Kapabacteria bacterium]|nr:OmpA family protein [Candidatus Kapabacteria bacterium]
QVTSVSSDNWSVLALSVGFEARYTFFDEPPPAIVPPPPPPPKPMPRLSASVEAVGVDEKGVESQVVQLQVEEAHTFETFPVLPYIFFPEGVSELPSKYARLTSTSSFSEKTIKGGTMEMYYNVLNIIGKRMHDYPLAKVTLTGCNANTGSETSNLSLSLSRAQSVKQYLNDVWHVTPDRIIVTARNRPEKESNSSTPQGMEENRRVEITSDVPQIFDPVPLDIVERTTTPSTIRINPHVIADNGVKQWTVTVWQEGRTLKTFTGTDSVPETIDWDPSDRDNSSPSADRIYYKINVTDKNGINYTSPDKFLSVDQFTETQTATGLKAYKISRFSLILFDFGKATLDPRNEAIVDQILKRVEPNSAVLVNGYADSLGGAQYNLDLSQKRAQATADLITKRCKFSISPTVVARGSSNLYDADDTPEGRYLSRTVEVLVRTPITE